ncbi:MAG: respiratory nitrate reductase subunit gamma [Sphingomonadaceae bacterium]
MIGPSLLLALTYISVLAFFTGVALTAAKYARAPMHLRWELYPVPHEKGKADHGGSYFEDPDWWTRPRDTSLSGEIRAMLEEMLLVRSLWHHNRPHWCASFPFHAGIYLLFGFTLLLVLGAALQPAGDPPPWWSVLDGFTHATGAAGLLSATFGALSLLRRRLTDARLRNSSTRADYVNLIFLLAVFLSAAFAWLTADPSLSQLRAFLRGALTFGTPPHVSPAVAAQVVVAALFLIYLPFTHMTHFVAKYFTYHQVRWDDAPNLGDPRMLDRMRSNLARPVGWSAPHIDPDESWADAASEAK